ncbi:MAG TPA: response regulator [Vicinamibacterales bacterium]|jgi:CheY-like chemotaxis protein
MVGNEPARTDIAPLVLIVEDDPETRQLYITVFEAEGFRTEAAHNGLQALDKANLAPPDLILTDIAVPGIDGIELCRRLRSNKLTEKIPLLAVTGYDDRHYPDRVLQAGANRVLLKPLHPDTLIEEARQLLAGARAQSAARP